MFWKRVAAIFLSATLSSCVSLPDDYEREPAWKLDGSGSGIGALLQDDLAAHPGLSGAYPLSDGMEALAARVVLARAAERSLDLQYYIWHPDIAGRILLKELLDAADRGVRVRLLLDDLGVGAADDEGFLLLDSHPSVAVHLFNPIALRNARTAGLVANPLRLNRRMHNKSMTADNLVTVVGGRNIGNEYFSLDELVNFADMDVLAVGPVVDEVSDAFDIYWNSDAAFPIRAFHENGRTPDQLARAKQKLEAYVAQNGDPYYEAMRATPLGLDATQSEVDPYWGVITALFDLPEKALGQETDLLLQQLGGLVGQVQQDILIISPYFVPGKEGTAALIAARQRGARVRVFTNSLAATDVAAVHAGYKKSRRDLLEGGVELFEMKPKLSGNRGAQKKLSYSGSSGASLHAKMFVFDRQRVFIGSMNLDPRSVDINTEIGLLIDSPELAYSLLDRFESRHDKAFYEVRLEPKDPDRPDGRQQLVWIDHGEGEEIRYTKEPETTFWQRFGVGFISLFPVDSQL
jgi:putative cardiolipin synthase